MKNSFKDILANLVDTLVNDPDLQGFAVDEFKKSIKVIKVLIGREHIKADMYPLIMITRPAGHSNGLNGTVAKNKDTIIKLYCGFKVGDSADIPKEHLDSQILFDEYLEVALLKNPSLGGKAVNTKLGAFRSEEGSGAPVYFFEKEITITQNINPNNR